MPFEASASWEEKADSKPETCILVLSVSTKSTSLLKPNALCYFVMAAELS